MSNTHGSRVQGIYVIACTASERVYALAGDITNALRDLSDTDWALGLEAVYMRIQEAHAALFRALGGRHMGAYKPGRAQVERAVVTLCVWQFVAMRAAERMRDGE